MNKLLLVNQYSISYQKGWKISYTTTMNSTTYDLFFTIFSFYFLLIKTFIPIDEESVLCCPPASEIHPRCKTIFVSRDDPFYSHFNVTCINFVRSISCPTGRLGILSITFILFYCIFILICGFNKLCLKKLYCAKIFVKWYFLLWVIFET